MTDIAPLTAEEMLARSAAAVKSGKTTAHMSAVQKLLAENGDGEEDIVTLSPVQQILQARKQAEESKENYFESDDYLNLKVGQLRAQLAIYTNLPGLDPNGAVLSGIEAEIKDLLSKQQEKLNESTKASQEAEDKLAEQERLKALELPSPESLLAKVRGETKKPALSDAVRALLDKAQKGASLDTTA